MTVGTKSPPMRYDAEYDCVIDADGIHHEATRADLVAEIERLQRDLAMANDAAEKGASARLAATGMELEIAELRDKLAFATQECGSYQQAMELACERREALQVRVNAFAEAFRLLRSAETLLLAARSAHEVAKKEPCS